MSRKLPIIKKRIPSVQNPRGPYKPTIRKFQQQLERYPPVAEKPKKQPFIFQPHITSLLHPFAKRIPTTVVEIEEVPDEPLYQMIPAQQPPPPTTTTPIIASYPNYQVSPSGQKVYDTEEIEPEPTKEELEQEQEQEFHSLPFIEFPSYQDEDLLSSPLESFQRKPSKQEEEPIPLSPISPTQPILTQQRKRKLSFEPTLPAEEREEYSSPSPRNYDEALEFQYSSIPPPKKVKSPLPSSPFSSPPRFILPQYPTQPAYSQLSSTDIGSQQPEQGRNESFSYFLPNKQGEEPKSGGSKHRSIPGHPVIEDPPDQFIFRFSPYFSIDDLVWYWNHIPEQGNILEDQDRNRFNRMRRQLRNIDQRGYLPADGGMMKKNPFSLDLGPDISLEGEELPGISAPQRNFPMNPSIPSTPIPYHPYPIHLIQDNPFEQDLYSLLQQRRPPMNPTRTLRQQRLEEGSGFDSYRRMMEEYPTVHRDMDTENNGGYSNINLQKYPELNTFPPPGLPLPLARLWPSISLPDLRFYWQYFSVPGLMTQQQMNRFVTIRNRINLLTGNTGNGFGGMLKRKNPFEPLYDIPQQMISNEPLYTPPTPPFRPPRNFQQAVTRKARKGFYEAQGGMMMKRKRTPTEVLDMEREIRYQQSLLNRAHNREISERRLQNLGLPSRQQGTFPGHGNPWRD